MAGLSNASAFQQSIERQSEFYRDPRRFSYHADAISATTTVSGLFSEVLASAAHKGVTIRSFIIMFNNGQTWDATNNFTFSLVHEISSGDDTLFSFDGNAVGAAGDYYVDMMDYPSVADVFSDLFEDGSETFSLVLTEEGTATISDINVLIEYVAVDGANPALVNEATAPA